MTLSATNATVTIKSRTQTRDAGGSLITKWVATNHNVRAYIQTNKRTEIQAVGGEHQGFGGIARFDGNVTIASGDRFDWAGRLLQVDSVDATYKSASIVDFYHAEWSEVTNAGL